MRKVVINKCYGGFGLSREALKRICKLDYIANAADKIACAPDGYWSDYDIPRDHPIVIKVVEEMGKASWGDFAELKVIEIPEDVEWEIDEYDGLEKVVEKRREWF